MKLQPIYLHFLSKYGSNFYSFFKYVLKLLSLVSRNGNDLNQNSVFDFFYLLNFSSLPLNVCSTIFFNSLLFLLLAVILDNYILLMVFKKRIIIEINFIWSRLFYFRWTHFDNKIFFIPTSESTVWIFIFLSKYFDE